jgi:hypothetical protein
MDLAAYHRPKVRWHRDNVTRGAWWVELCVNGIRASYRVQRFTDGTWAADRWIGNESEVVCRGKARACDAKALALMHFVRLLLAAKGVAK